MKFAYLSIPFVFLASVCAGPASALPNEPDSSCYVITPYGEAIDLAPMCSNPVRQEFGPNRQNTFKQARNVRYGQVPQVAMQVYLSNGVWVTYGKIQNQTDQAIEGIRVTLEIADSSGRIQTQTTNVDQAFLRPGELGSFQIGIRYDSVRQIEGQQLAVPAVRVASVQWINQDGTIGNNP